MTDPYPWEQRGPCPCPTCTEDRLAGKRALEAAEAERDALRDAARAVIAEWDERGDNGCMRVVQDRLRAALGGDDD